MQALERASERVLGRGEKGSDRAVPTGISGRLPGDRN